MKQELERFIKEKCNRCKESKECKITIQIDGRARCTKEEWFMKNKMRYKDCMKTKCTECKNYNYCFMYKKKGNEKDDRRKSNKRF